MAWLRSGMEWDRQKKTPEKRTKNRESTPGQILGFPRLPEGGKERRSPKVETYRKKKEKGEDTGVVKFP